METLVTQAAPSLPRAPRPGAAPRPAPRSGWPAFDELGLVRPGRVLLVDVGSEAGGRLLFGLLADAVGRAGEAVVLDGGNWLDVYRLGDCAEAIGVPRLATLHGVRVARGFTAHQLQSLAEDALPRVVAEGGASVGLVLAASLPEMYLDEDMKADEARALVARALAVLRRVARDHDVPVIVSNATLAPGVRHRLRTALEEGVDDAVGLFPAPHGGLRIAVPGAGSVLAPRPGARQRLLGEFAPAEGDAGRFVRHAPDARLKYAPKRAGELRWTQRAQVRAVA